MVDKPRVFIVDDHQLFRSGVRAELGDAVDVVGDADEVSAAIELITERKPDVVLIDVHMPDGGVRRCGGRHQRHQGGRPGLRHEDDLRPGAGRRHLPSCRR